MHLITHPIFNVIVFCTERLLLSVSFFRCIVWQLEPVKIQCQKKFATCLSLSFKTNLRNKKKTEEKEKEKKNNGRGDNCWAVTIPVGGGWQQLGFFETHQDRKKSSSFLIFTTTTTTTTTTTIITTITRQLPPHPPTYPFFRRKNKMAIWNTGESFGKKKERNDLKKKRKNSSKRLFAYLLTLPTQLWLVWCPLCFEREGVHLINASSQWPENKLREISIVFEKLLKEKKITYLHMHMKNV